MGSNCGCGAGGNKARNRRAGFHLPAWAGLDALSMQTLAELGTAESDSDAADDSSRGMVRGDDQDSATTAGGLAPTLWAGSHGVLTCMDLSLDILLHESLVRFLEKAANDCDQTPGCDTDGLVAALQQATRDWLDAKAEYQERCTGIGFFVPALPGLR